MMACAPAAAGSTTHLGKLSDRTFSVKMVQPTNLIENGSLRSL